MDGPFRTGEDRIGLRCAQLRQACERLDDDDSPFWTRWSAFAARYDAVVADRVPGSVQRAFRLVQDDLVRRAEAYQRDGQYEVARIVFAWLRDEAVAAGDHAARRRHGSQLDMCIAAQAEQRHEPPARRRDRTPTAIVMAILVLAAIGFAAPLCRLCLVG